MLWKTQPLLEVFIGVSQRLELLCNALQLCCKMLCGAALCCVCSVALCPMGALVSLSIPCRLFPPVGQFANGEIDIKILGNVRGDDVFVLQPTCASSTTDLNTSV